MSKTTSLVSEGRFAFTNGAFFAETSDRNQHRRATPEELRAHFAFGSNKDHPAHWFEAQLIHYGLQPSKVKSVARMRLFDAVRERALSVPSHITELENKLHKKWMKRSREDKEVAAKSMISTVVPQVEATEKPTARKRKANVTVNVTINANQLGNAASSAPMANETKRVKTTEFSEDRFSAKPQYARMQTARRGGSARISTRSEPTASISLPSDPTAAAAPAPRVSHMARRGTLSFQRSRIQAPIAQRERHIASIHTDPFDEPPPPYEDYPEKESCSDRAPEILPLGLLNGRYDISCPFVESEWPQHASELSLVLTIAGSSLWGRFDLGVIEGVIRFEERPWSSSYDKLPFYWRGHELEGPICYDDSNNRGWMTFLGDGRIEGWIDHQGIQFEGQRLPGQGTRSEIDIRAMHDEWDRYSEEEYDRLNRARWR
ncbi:hypothetical protein V8C35DRAFT_330715 [Trichoderma chlorosporum]